MSYPKAETGRLPTNKHGNKSPSRKIDFAGKEEKHHTGISIVFFFAVLLPKVGHLLILRNVTETYLFL